MTEYVIETLSKEAQDLQLSPCILCALRDTSDCASIGIPLCTAGDATNDYILIKPVK